MPSPSRTERRFPPLTPAGWLLLAIRIPLLAGWLAICVIMHIIRRGRGGRSRWTGRFLSGSLAIIGARLSTRGTPLRSDVLILANHQSWLDIMALGATSGSRFLSKAEVGDVPLIGFLASLNETIYISREQRLAVAGQVAKLRAALAEGRPVALFPEGTTLGGMDLLPFKPALLKVLEPPLPGLLVQPAYIDFGPEGDDLAWKKEPGVYNALRIAGRTRGFDLTVHFLEPLDPAAFADRKALAAAAHREVAAAKAGATGANATGAEVAPLSTGAPSDYRPAA